MIANEPWRSFETLFLKLKTANDDDFTVWQAGLRLAPPVQSAERWLGITLSSAISSVASVQHPIQPVRGKVGAGSMLVLQLLDYRDFVDSHGVEEGVALSQQLLSNLTNRLSDNDQAWRLSDDVMALWFPGDTRGKRSEQLWFSILQTIESPMVVGATVHRARIRGGRARAVNPESRAEQLIERAMAGLVGLARAIFIRQARRPTKVTPN